MAKSTETGKVTKPTKKPCADKVTVAKASKIAEFVFSATRLPQIPRLRLELEQELDSLRDVALNNLRIIKRRKKASQKKKKTKLNAFIGFRSYHSRDISTTLQGMLSFKLSKAWAEEHASQIVWERYVSEYNLRNIEESFVDWLVGTFKPQSVCDPRLIDGSQRFSRIEDVFEDESSQIVHDWPSNAVITQAEAEGLIAAL